MGHKNAVKFIVLFLEWSCILVNALQYACSLIEHIQSLYKPIWPRYCSYLQFTQDGFVHTRLLQQSLFLSTNALITTLFELMHSILFLLLLSETIEQEVVPKKPTIITVNCTVAFLSQCTSWMKCRTSCQSMGASSYRWFHDGCCECVGERCINYGINESRWVAFCFWWFIFIEQ